MHLIHQVIEKEQFSSLSETLDRHRFSAGRGFDIGFVIAFRNM